MRVFSVQAAQVNIYGAAEMLFVRVSGEMQPQVAVQCQGVEVVLQDVGMLCHGADHAGMTVVAAAEAEVIGFPVDDVVAAVVLKDQIHEAVQHAAALLELQ